MVLSTGSTRAKIRVAEPNDLGTVLFLLEEMNVELFDSIGAKKVRGPTEDLVTESFDKLEIAYFLAFAGDVPCGVGKVQILHYDPIFRLLRDQRCGYIDDMYVRPGFRKRGIAADIVEALECWVMDRGIYNCILHSAPKAIGFYMKKGYQHNREMHKQLRRKVRRNAE